MSKKTPKQKRKRSIESKAKVLKKREKIRAEAKSKREIANAAYKMRERMEPIRNDN